MRSHTRVNVAGAVQLFHMGVRLQSIASYYGVDTERVRDVLRDEGLDTRRVYDPDAPTLESIGLPTHVLLHDREAPLDAIQTKERLEEMTLESFEDHWVMLVVDMLTSDPNVSVRNMAEILTTVRKRYRDANELREQGQGAHAAA